MKSPKLSGKLNYCRDSCVRSTSNSINALAGILHILFIARAAFVDGNGNVENLALQDQSQTILKYLLTKGADCNARDACMQTPLHYAALKGNLLAVEILINTTGIQLEVCSAK